MASVHIMKRFFMSPRLYVCETWLPIFIQLIQLHWIILVEKFSIVAGQKVQSCCCSIVAVVHCQLYTRLISHQIKCHSSVLLGVLANSVILKFCQLQRSTIFIVRTCLSVRWPDQTLYMQDICWKCCIQCVTFIFSMCVLPFQYYVLLLQYYSLQAHKLCVW